MVGLMSPASRNSTLPRQVRDNPIGRVGTGYNGTKMTLGLHGDGATFVAPSPIMGAT